VWGHEPLGRRPNTLEVTVRRYWRTVCARAWRHCQRRDPGGGHRVCGPSLPKSPVTVRAGSRVRTTGARTG